ncbi:hypothetical protein G7Z17_g12152 [Cylindrodendrum hubeiense]|uniref:Uncharacterized protein n=1 Tax=Cylindrodendrum hubeiense TaxID=595255 RepID=A0A9P5LAL9_9HYPO|nr:hypothetical protein G7Z17_g12152 [Cylindrodendrum hubeiense]
MDRSSRRVKSQPHRGRGGARGGAFAPKAAGEKAWSKDKAMGTAKSMADNGRQRARRFEDDEFLGRPPPGRDLILPGALNDIRRAHKVYITNVQPNILDIHCESMSRMQQAVHALNWAIHDLRLSNEHPPVRFLVQEPTNADIKDMIRVEIGSRPRFTSRCPTLVNNSSAMETHIQRLCIEIPNSANTLMALNKNMKMRVNFGHLDVRSRNTRGRDEITHDEFVKLLSMYSVRGGASLETNGHQDVTQGCEVTLVVQGMEIKADAMDPVGENTQLSTFRAVRSEAWGRLNWTVVAPDMQYDWNLRVDAWDDEDIPLAFKDLSQKLLLTVNSTQDLSDLIRIPHISTHKLGDLRGHVGQLKLKTSATIPYKTTPYVIEISITKIWKGACTTDEPDITWGIEFYAAHWDESIMHVSGGDNRKDWGQGLENIWPGDEPGLESRFRQFVGTVLEMQALLDGACPT